MFRLCLAGLAKHPDELREQLTSRQMADWEAFFQIEPFGPLEDELRLAIIAREAANSHPYRRLPAETVDFMPSYVPGWDTDEAIHARFSQVASRGPRKKD